MSPLGWALLSSFAMAAFMVLEMLTPSFGLLTLVSLAFFVVSVFTAFGAGDSAGYAMFAFNLALLPLTIWLSMRFMKRSPMRHNDSIQVGTITLQEEAPEADASTLPGKEGPALTPLRPSGFALLDGSRREVVTEGRFVESGTPVRVLRVEGSRIVVEPCAVASDK